MRLNEMPSGVTSLRTLSVSLVVVLMLIFSGVLTTTFVIYDDPEYVTENVNVLGGITGKGAAWAFSSFDSANWHPLTWLSHMLDVQLFGLNPAGHHATSLALHIATTVLLFIVLTAMTGACWRSYATALLFGIHPLHVESVAWIAERKDVLSGLFFVLTLWAYAGYVEKTGIRRYALVLVLFACGLMAKPMLVTLPLVLLLLDYWPLQRLRNNRESLSVSALLYEKIPLVVLSVISTVITCLAQQRGGATPTLDNAFAASNISNGLVSYATYCMKLLWPQALTVFYPRVDSSVIGVAAASASLVILSIAALLVRKKFPFVCVGWFWFIGTLVPVIGFVRIGSSAMSDRYTYIPSIGIFMLICWLAGEFASRRASYAKMTVALFFAVVATFSLLSVQQIRYWKNSFTLFEHALDVTSGNWLAYNNLASAYILWAHDDTSVNLTRYVCSPNGCPRDAYTGFNCLNRSIEASRAAVRIKPDYASAQFNLGLASFELGDRQSALDSLNTLKVIDPLLAERLEKSLVTQ